MTLRVVGVVLLCPPLARVTKASPGSRDARRPLTSTEIGEYSERGDVAGLRDALASHFALTHRTLGDDAPVALREALVAKGALTRRGAGSHYTTAYKLDHDIEQLEYVARESPWLRDDALRRKIEEEALPALKGIRARVPSLRSLERTKGLYGFTPRDLEDAAEWYNRATFTPDPKVDSPLCADRDWHVVERTYEENSVVVVDDVLSPRAFDALRELLLSSTVFFETKMPLVFGGYVGAVVEDGLHATALLQLADELRRNMPNVLNDHSLRYLWCYKYDARYQGIDVHADEAAVNFNLWLTPDEANRDPGSGGLVVYLVKPPQSASLEEYNQRGAAFAADLIAASNHANVTVPYRANRAVMFDSALFHRTDAFHFKPGYRNRRINLTLLFGSMQKAPALVPLDPHDDDDRAGRRRVSSSSDEL